MMAAAAIPAMALASCSDDNPGSDKNNGGTSEGGRFVFATTVPTSNGTSYLLLTGESLDEGVVSPFGNGLLTTSATQWVFYKDYLYGLTYNQGEAGTTSSFILGEDGEMQARDNVYRLDYRFSSYGMYDNDIITMSTGAGPTAFADSHGYLPMTLLVNYLDVVNETMTANDINSGLYSMENFLGNGEYVTLSGAEQSGSKLYCGAIPMGLSQYGVMDNDGKWVLPGNEDLVHSESGGTGASSYNANELVGTQYPNKCYVAIYDNDKFLNPVIAETDRISTPCGRFRSQYYQTIWAAENGDIYVFSPSYAKTMTAKSQRTDLAAGVCRIKAGQTTFDDYYVNLEEQTGNRSFMRCWPAGGNCFLMVMYDRPLTESGFAATDLAIFNADTEKLTYVTGLPEGVSSFGKTVYTQNGKVYIPVNVTNEYPAIYAIDINTADAVKGVTIEGASDVTGFGYMTPKK